MAANIRKAAAARGIDTKVVARGESEIENYIEDIDVLMRMIWSTAPARTAASEPMPLATPYAIAR